MLIIKLCFHNSHINHFGIDFKGETRQRKKFDIYKLNIFDKNRKIHKLKKEEVLFLEEQVKDIDETKNNEILTYKNKLQIVIKDGKHY